MTTPPTEGSYWRFKDTEAWKEQNDSWELMPITKALPLFLVVSHYFEEQGIVTFSSPDNPSQIAPVGLELDTLHEFYSEVPEETAGLLFLKALAERETS